MIATLSFLLKISITAISFYWRNDTPTFCHLTECTSPNQFVPEIVSPFLCSSGLVRHTLLYVYFFKQLISFIGSLDKCHTSVFNAGIFPWFSLRSYQNTVIRFFFFFVHCHQPSNCNCVTGILEKKLSKLCFLSNPFRQLILLLF